MRTKRTYIILLLLILGCGFAFPQKKKTKQQVHRHYIDFYAGGGVSSLGYDLLGGYETITPSFTVGAGYTYYFLPWMGLQTGLGFTRYSSNAHLTDEMVWTPLTDYQGDLYEHHITFDRWKERQQAYLLEIPIGLRFQPIKKKVGLYAALGAKLGIPVLADYRHRQGSLTHYGVYPDWNLEVRDLPGRFETETTETLVEASVKEQIRKVNAVAYAELGMAFRTGERADIYLAAYAHYVLNNFSAVSNDERTALGFASDKNNAYGFMQPYNGLIGTNHIGSMHPWTAGLKAGISIYPGLTKAQRKRQARRLAKEFPELMPKNTVHDTLLLSDTIYLHDTIYIREPQKQPVQQAAPKERPTAEEKRLAALLSQAVIWFHFDKYDPILEPAYILDSVASMMKRYPDLTIHVNGHACIIGKDGYNQRLALKRANAVANLLQKKGIGSERMKVVSYGASHPYRYNHKHQLAKDRRVEIVPEGYELQPEDQQLTSLNEAREQTSAVRASAFEKYEHFIGEETVRPGSRLAQIARRWYGLPQYWVYIYEANADKIKDFSNVHPGLVVMIPDLKYIHQGLSDKEALEHAKKIEKHYLKR